MKMRKWKTRLRMKKMARTKARRRVDKKAKERKELEPKRPVLQRLGTREPRLPDPSKKRKHALELQQDGPDDGADSLFRPLSSVYHTSILASFAMFPLELVAVHNAPCTTLFWRRLGQITDIFKRIAIRTVLSDCVFVLCVDVSACHFPLLRRRSVVFLAYTSCLSA
jgi:hypothetical protein